MELLTIRLNKIVAKKLGVLEEEKEVLSAAA